MNLTPSPTAIRLRRFAQRHRQGLIVVPIEANKDALVEALKTAGLLHPDKEDDREAIKAALTCAVEIFVMENTCDDCATDRARSRQR